MVGADEQNNARGGIALALATVGLGLWATVAWQQLATSEEDRAARAYRAAGHCLLGEAEGRAIARLRSRAIAADLEAGSGWPERCAPPLNQLRRRLDTLLIEHRQRCDSAQCCPDDARCDALARLRDEVDRAVAYASYGTDFDPTDLKSLGDEIGFSEGAIPEGAPQPIAPARILEPAQLRPLFRGNYLRLLTDPDGDSGIDLLFYEDNARYTLCRLGLLDTDPARCGDLGASIPVGLAGELLASEDGATRRMYAQGPAGEGPGEKGWRHGLFDVDSGEELRKVAYRPRGGFAWRDGRYAWLGLEPPMTSLSVFREDGASSPPPEVVAVEAASALPRVFYDTVVWAEALASGRHRVIARRLGKESLGPPNVLGDLEGPTAPVFELCRTKESLMLLALTERSRRGTRGTLFQRTDGGWRAPRAIFAGTARFGFTCQRDTATLSWILGEQEQPEEPPGAFDDAEASPVRGRYHVHRLRCHPERCEHEQASLELRRHDKRSRYVAGDLGEAMVVVYRSPLGDVRMRVAPIDQLADAKDIPLFDDLEHDGFGWDLERDPIFGRGGAMVVLTSRQVESTIDSAVYGFRVNAAGTVTPVEVQKTVVSR